MSGGAGSRLRWTVRESVGLCLAADGLVLVRLCEAEGRWMVVETRTSDGGCPAPSDPEAFAASVRAELVRAGWEQMPLGLALPSAMAETEERVLPAALTGSEMREALLWSMRAEADVMGVQMSDGVEICCTPLRGTAPPRYWVAQMGTQRIQAYFSAFSSVGLRLLRLTVCPPDGGVLAAEIEAAREPRMPWERIEPDGDAAMPAVYAGLLVRAGTPEHLYWGAQGTQASFLRPYAAAVVAVLAAAVFLACVAADAASYMTMRAAYDTAAEERALRASEQSRMEEFSLLEADVSRRSQLLGAFMSESLPVRALLVHLGTMAADDVRFTDIRAETHGVRIEGVAADYAAVSALVAAMEDDPAFFGEIALEQAGEADVSEGAPKRVRFFLRSSW